MLNLTVIFDTVVPTLSACLTLTQVFKPDKANGFDVQTEADAMMERQRKEVLPSANCRTPGTPRTPSTPRRFVAWVKNLY